MLMLMLMLLATFEFGFGIGLGLGDGRCHVDGNDVEAIAIAIEMVLTTIRGLLKVDEAIRIVAFHLIQRVAVDSLRGLLLGAGRAVVRVDLVQADALQLAGATVQLLLPIHVELARDGRVVRYDTRRMMRHRRMMATERSPASAIAEPVVGQSAAGHQLDRLGLCGIKCQSVVSFGTNHQPNSPLFFWAILMTKP